MKKCKHIFGVLACMIVLAGCGNGPANKITIAEDNILKETIVIENLEGDYELLFLTDTHMVVSSSDDSEQEAANAADRGPQFVDAAGVSSREQFPGWMDYADKRQVDGVLLGGDIIDYPSRGNLEYLEKNLNTLSMPYIYMQWVTMTGHIHGNI